MMSSEKTIVITGGSRGLGRETALFLSGRNPNLVLIARDQVSLEGIQNKIENRTGKRPMIIPCNISNEKEVTRLPGIIRRRFHHVDVLINNAGIGIHKNSEELSSEEMRRQFEVNFYGPFYMIKTLLPLLKRSVSPYILNISSLACKVPFPGNCIYAATKSALTGFSEGLHSELKTHNIKLGLFFPGPMNTSFQSQREQETKAPAFFWVDPVKASKRLAGMIYGRRKKVYMYRWMLLPMKIKQLIG